MNRIIRKEQFSEKVFLFEIEAPLTTKSGRVDNFVTVRVGHKGGRMPLTIADTDIRCGTIALVVQKVDLSSMKPYNLNEGDYAINVVGPLGNAAYIGKFGTILCAGGGVGVALILPIIKALKEAGNKVLSVSAGRSKDLVILEDEVRVNSDEAIIITDDGSYGKKGVIAVGMEKLIKQEHTDKAFAVGSLITMKLCCLLTQKYNIPINVSLDTTIVDGMGMCGAYRLTIGGKTEFVCIDGPEFDGALADQDEILKRVNTLKDVGKDEIEHLQDHPNELENTQEKHASTIKMDVEPAQESIPILTDQNAEWRKTLQDSMKPKKRKSTARMQMPELDPTYRATTRTEEVNLGLMKEMAMTEAKRRLDCAKPACVEGRLVNVNIPPFIENIERGQFLAAARMLENISALPAVYGRVYPQEEQCESKCTHLRMNEPVVATGYFECSTADYGRENGDALIPNMQSGDDTKVAVAGSGPVGLSFTGDMAKRGYQVRMFKVLYEMGGMLKYGIPEFRLPSAIIDVEIENLRKMGVHSLTDCIIGKTLSIEELKEEDSKGIFVGSGAGLPNFMGIPGGGTINIMSSSEYLTRISLMDAANTNVDILINLGKKVMIVGGGNTAMDSYKTTKRLGVGVTLVYRCSEAEMSAQLEEVKHAKGEGIHFMCLHNPIGYLTDEKGIVNAAALQVMQLGEPNASSRCNSVSVEGQTITLEVDQVVMVVGISPNPPVPKSIQGLEFGRKNTIVINGQVQLSRSEIYAGNDIVRGGVTVALAMDDDRRAVASMDIQLRAER